MIEVYTDGSCLRVLREFWRFAKKHPINGFTLAAVGLYTTRNVLRAFSAPAGEYWPKDIAPVEGLELAELAFNEEDYDECLEVCDEALGENPKDVSFLLLRSRTFLKVHLTTEAFTDAVDAIALDRDRAEAWLYLGIASMDIGALDKAREAFETAEKMEPSSTSRGALILKWLVRLREAEEREQEEHQSETTASKDTSGCFKWDWYQSQTHVTLEIFAKE